MGSTIHAVKGRAINGGLVGYFLSGWDVLSPDSGASDGSSFSTRCINSPLVTHTNLIIVAIAGIEEFQAINVTSR